jgi:hypothetical protein
MDHDGSVGRMTTLTSEARRHIILHSALCTVKVALIPYQPLAKVGATQFHQPTSRGSVVTTSAQYVSKASKGRLRNV